MATFEEIFSKKTMDEWRIEMKLPKHSTLLEIQGAVIAHLNRAMRMGEIRKVMINNVFHYEAPELVAKED